MPAISQVVPILLMPTWKPLNLKRLRNKLLKKQTKIHQPTLLHKRIYEKNLTVNNNVRIFFKVSFSPPTLKIEYKTQMLQFSLNV